LLVAPGIASLLDVVGGAQLAEYSFYYAAHEIAQRYPRHYRAWAAINLEETGPRLIYEFINETPIEEQGTGFRMLLLLLGGHWWWPSWAHVRSRYCTYGTSHSVPVLDCGSVFAADHCLNTAGWWHFCRWRPFGLFKCAATFH